MRDIPPRVSEEQLPWVQVAPYHPHNSVNLPRHLLHSTLLLLLGGDDLGHLYIHYTTMGMACTQFHVPTTVRIKRLFPRKFMNSNFIISKNREGNFILAHQFKYFKPRLSMAHLLRIVHPEWPHRQGGCTFESPMRLHRFILCRGAQGVLPMRVGGATSQLDLPSLTPLSVADCCS